MKFIAEKKGNFEQKQQRRNLKILQLLKTEEGMEEYRNMVLAKLHYGFLEYGSLEKEMERIGFDKALDYDNNLIEKDDINDDEFYNGEKREVDDLNPDYNDGNIVYDSDDDVEDEDYVNIKFDD